MAYQETGGVRSTGIPVDQTVLANEQVIEGLRLALRCAGGTQREISQWFLRITAYAQELLDDIDTAGRLA